MHRLIFASHAALCCISANRALAPEGGGGGSNTADADAASAAAAAAAEAAAEAAAAAAAPPAPSKPVKPAAKGKADAKDPLEEATVLRGTVMQGDHPDEEAVGPGGKVTLPASEVRKLRQRGILVDPNSAPMYGSGPISDIDKVGPAVGQA